MNQDSCSLRLLDSRRIGASWPRLSHTAMSIVTLQVGQAGCQGGASLFQLLAQEAAPQAEGEWSEAAERWFSLTSVGGRIR